MRIMGKYDDFELDLSVNKTKKSDDLGFSDFPVSDLTKSYAQSCYSCPAQPLTCDCSASDMNACLGNARC